MKKSKGTVIVDIDGVLLDFYNPFLGWYNGKHASSFSIDYLKRYDIASGLSIDPQEIVNFHKEECCGSLPLIDADACLFLSTVRSQGYSIVLNTDWPADQIEKRERNLALHAIPYDAIHYGKKAAIVHLYDDIVLILEDNPKWIDLYLAQGHAVAVPHRPYLREEKNVRSRRILRYDQLFEIFRYFFVGE